MLKCNICNNSFETLKSNTHIIPRCLIVETKENGKNVYISPRKLHERNQTDLVLDNGWCEFCEKLFSEDDAFAKLFIKDKKYIIGQRTSKIKNEIELGIEEHEATCGPPLKRFLVGIILRHSIFLMIKESLDLLGPHFEALRELYFTSKTSDASYPLSIIKYTDLRLMGYPTREKYQGLNAVSGIFGSYKMILFVNKQHLCPKEFEQLLITSKQVRILVTTSNDSNMKKEIIKRITDLKGKEE